ncbi:MAG: fumarate reductase (CoM/CoB) subunit TfrB [Methanobacteriaceae archaeon]|nr:fumarate reductase (CoM/CoB) subunit TfrB [Methanobacteriaceae archaeon]
MINVKVKRYNPKNDETYIESYDVKKENKMKILDALQYINSNYDADIAYRYSCRAGQCGSCAIKVNDEIKLACKAEIQDNDLLEPLDFKVIKDLIIDRSKLDSKISELNLFLETEDDEEEIPSEPEIIQPKDYAKSRKIRSCIECFSCLSACPVINKTDEFVGPYFMRSFSDLAFDPRNDNARTEESKEAGLYCCTSCGKCGKVCPKEINIFGNAIEKLRDQACKDKIGPLPEHKAMKKNIDETGRSVKPNLESEYPNGFIKSLPESDKKGKIAFFTGCMIDNKLPEIGQGLINILEKLGYTVDIPKQQVCCGSPLIRTGQLDSISNLVKQNYETFKDYDIVLTVCAGCGATLKNDYPNYDAKLNVMDISEFLVDKLDIDKMKELDLKVTYHDPCHLARSQGIREEPRKILENIKGVEFIEMEHPDTCCGAGGGVKSGKPDIAMGLAKDRAEDIKKLDVDYVVTICPFCEYNIQDALNEEKIDVPVINIIKLLEKAYS